MGSHPIQAIFNDAGVIRFRRNAIVRYLLDFGPFDMNHLMDLPFDQYDREQFAQLLGYSVSGFGDLPYASSDVVAKANGIAAGLV